MPLKDNKAERALVIIEKSIADSSQLPADGDDKAAVLHTLIFQHQTWFEILESLGRDDEAAAVEAMTATLREQLQSRD